MSSASGSTVAKNAQVRRLNVVNEVKATDVSATNATVNTVFTNTISERTEGSGVTIDGLLIKDGAIPGLPSSSPSYLKCSFNQVSVSVGPQVLNSLSQTAVLGSDITLTSSSVITINTTGLYLFKISGSWGPSATDGHGTVDLYNNTDTAIEDLSISGFHQTGGGDTSGSLTALVYATAADTFSIRMSESNTGAGVTFSAVGNKSVFVAKIA